MGISDNSFAEKTASWLIAASLLFSVYNEFFFKPINAVLYIGIVLVSVSILYGSFNAVLKDRLNKTILYALGVWLWCVVLAIIQDGENPQRIPVLEALVYSGLLVFLLGSLKIFIFPLKIALYLIIAFFYYEYFIIGDVLYGIQDYGVEGLHSGSINTVILLSISITIQVVDYRDNSKLALLPSMLIIPIAIMSWNRTGLATSVIYFLSVLYVGTHEMKSKYMQIILMIIVTMVVAYAGNRYWNLIQDTPIFTKIEDGGLETGRNSIWASYFEGLGFTQYLLGRAIDSRHTLSGGFENAHNSFIMMHSQIGFLFFVFCFFSLKKIWYYFKRNKFLFLLFMVLILRSSFDMMFFFHPYDYAFYIFLFDFNRLNKKKQISVGIV